MFYVKENFNDAMEVTIEINDENVYCTCPVCRREVFVDLEEVLKDGDLFSTQVCCDRCSNKLGGKHDQRTI